MVKVCCGGHRRAIPMLAHRETRPGPLKRIEAQPQGEGNSEHAAAQVADAVVTIRWINRRSRAAGLTCVRRTSYFLVDRCSPEPIGHGHRTVWRHDEHVDERRNANNQEAEQNGGNESSGSPPPRCPTLKHWEIALSCHSCGVRLEAHRGLSLAPCVGFDNYLLAYSGRTLVGLGCCFFRHPAAPRQFPR